MYVLVCGGGWGGVHTAMVNGSLQKLVLSFHCVPILSSGHQVCRANAYLPSHRSSPDNLFLFPLSLQICPGLCAEPCGQGHR